MTGQVGAATMLEFGLDGDLPCSPPPAVTGPPDFGLILNVWNELLGLWGE